MKYLLLALLLSGCCTGTQEGMWLVGHTFCPAEWGMASNQQRQNRCYDDCIRALGHDDYSCAVKCR